MATALKTIDSGTFLALRDDNDIAEAMLANLGEGAMLRESNLTRVKIPTGGGVMWMVPTLTGDEPSRTIDGILVYQTVRGILWLGEEPQEGSLPALVSTDLKTARTIATDLPGEFLRSIEPALIDDARGIYDWTLLPQNEWGSGKGGNGKAAKEQRVLYILRQDEPLPVVVAIQPGSLGNWQEFIIQLTKAGIPFYRAVISLGLERAVSVGGQPYSQVLPKLIGTLTPEQGTVIRTRFTEPMRAVAAACFTS